jgi:hypothetical protein
MGLKMDVYYIKPWNLPKGLENSFLKIIF